MEANYIRRRRYSLRFQASSFFSLALLIRLSGTSIRSFRSFSLRSDTEDRGKLCTMGGNMGPIVSGRHRGAGHTGDRRRGAGHRGIAGHRGAGHAQITLAAAILAVAKEFTGQFSAM